MKKEKLLSRVEWRGIFREYNFLANVKVYMHYKIWIVRTFVRYLN